MRKKLVLSAVIFAMLLFAFVACGGGGSALVGRWEVVSGRFIVIEDGEQYEEPMENVDVELEFFSDGHGRTVVDGRYTSRFTWSAENGRLTLTDVYATNVMDYSISRSTLTITSEFGMGITAIQTLHRVN